MSRRLVGAVVLLLALAGCGGDPKADPPPTPSPSTSPVSTTPSAPAMPEAAKENSKAGAIAFVRHYIAVFNRAQSTGDTQQLAALSSPDCADCQAAIDGLKRIYETGGKIAGGDLEPGPATAAQNKAEHRWLVLIRIESGPQSVTTAANAAPSQMPGGTRSMEFGVKHEASTWKVASWTRA